VSSFSWAVRSLSRAVVQDDDPPLVFSNAFYAITTTVTGSADGMTSNELPISIEEVCDVPQALATEDGEPVPTFSVSRADITD
jgi:hypothetical protein